MSGSKDDSSEPTELRKKAEERVKQKVNDLRRQPAMDKDRLVHELQIHQLELEMQNEELRRTQVELEQSRAKYFNLFDLAPVGYFTLSEKNLIVEANLSGSALLGAERSLLAGRPFTRFIVRDFQDAFYLHRRNVLDTRIRQTCELKLLKTDGSEFHAQMISSPAANEQDDGSRLRVAVIDISERKQVEEALKQNDEALRTAKEDLEEQVDERTAELRRSVAKLQEAELRYRTIADFNYDWEYWETPDSTLSYVSPSCERLTGYKAEEYIDNAHLLSAIVLDEDRDVWYQHRKDELARHGLLETQFRIRTKDDRIRWIEHACQRVYNKEGQFLGFRASNRDITDRKLVEEELSRSRESLRWLTRKLLAAQEEERRRLAREMHDDLSQRLATLAIEAGKLGKELESSPEPVRDRVKHIKEQLVVLSGDVHGISRQLHPAVLDDLGLVDALRTECINFSRREGISIKYEPDDVIPSMPRECSLGVYRIVQESLRNIAAHARVKTAEVSLESIDGSVHVTIKDQGIGFDPEKTGKSGGIGLACMRERAALIGSELTMKSWPGQGTVVTVRVPISGKSE